MQPRRDDERHWGPRIQNTFPVKGTIGLIITVGLMIGLLGALPAARLWIYISIPIGIIVAVVLHFVRR